MLQTLPIDKISKRADARVIDEATVAALADSIANVGLLNPIRVRVAGDGWEVIAGAHRFAAHQHLGLADITADVVTDDDLHAELAMIDENLCRAELSPSDRARQTARRAEIYRELHPETAKGGNQGPVGQFVRTEAKAFAIATAALTGTDERSVRRDAERGSKVIEEVLDLIRGTSLDTGTYLDRIKNLSPSEQLRAATRDLAYANKKERDNERSKAEATKRNKIQGDVKARAAKEVAEIIAEHVPSEWWDAVKSNLYAAGASNVAHEFTNITGQSIMDRGAA